MRILSHRGYWKEISEKNTVKAFQRSFSMGFGTETDIRDYNGDIVISHDIANKKSVSVEEFFSIYKEFNSPLPLALNIKADGLQAKLNELIVRYHIQDYFVFDMSVPDTLGYSRSGMPFFTRQSEYELEPVLYDQATGVWMDCFFDEWINEGHIESHLKAGKRVCLVSPELHKRDHLPFWTRLSKMNTFSDNLMLCTDFPEEARGFFHGKN